MSGGVVDGPHDLNVNPTVSSPLKKFRFSAQMTFSTGCQTGYRSCARKAVSRTSRELRETLCKIKDNGNKAWLKNIYSDCLLQY